MVRGGTREGPAYGSGDQREEHERMRSGGRAHGGRYEAVVQGMELPDVGVEIAGRRRQIGVAQPAFAMEAATCGGTDFLSSITGRASSVTIFITIACADAPVCGGSPVNIS